jgi:hypothetical protein
MVKFSMVNSSSFGGLVKPFINALSVSVLVVFAIPQARAGFDLGTSGANNFAVLFEGLGSNSTLNFNNSNISGNVGIGNAGFWADAGGCGTPKCQVNGLVEFSAGNTGQFSSNSDTTYTPALANNVNPLYSQSSVTTALNGINSLSTHLAGEAGAGLVVNINNAQSQTINASAGISDGAGNRVFNVTSFNFNGGSTLTINGDAAGDSVVLNFGSNVEFKGTILLTGGLTSDQVLFNVTGSNHTLTINSNKATETGTFLDPNSAISISDSVLNGRLFGGDSTNLQFVSGANIDDTGAGGQGGMNTPEPSFLGLLSVGVMALIGVNQLRNRRASALRS